MKPSFRIFPHLGEEYAASSPLMMTRGYLYKVAREKGL